MRALVPLLLALVAGSASAQTSPSPAADSAVHTVDFRPDQVVRLDLAEGFQLGLELAAADPVLSIAIGDPDMVQATVAKAGDRIYLQALRSGGLTNMTVVTANRRYLFDLNLGGGGYRAAYAVQFRYPPAPSVAETAPPVAQYRITGARDLVPAAMSDDGVRTSIAWAPDAPLPAVFAVDGRGRERIVGGHMRDGVFVIDAVNPRLVFRIDSHAAWAARRPLEGADGR